MSNSLPEEGSGQELFHGTGAACAKALRFSERSTWLDFTGSRMLKKACDPCSDRELRDQLLRRKCCVRGWGP